MIGWKWLLRKVADGEFLKRSGNEVIGASSGVASNSAPFVTVANDSGLSAERRLQPESGVLALTDGGANGDITVSVATNGISNAKLRQSVGVSVIGRSASSTGDVADIVAGADGDALRRSGGTLNWGPPMLNNSMTESASTTLTTAGTFYDGASLTLGPGVWLICGGGSVQGPDNTAIQGTVRLWDGSVAYGALDGTSPAMGASTKSYVGLSVVGIVNITSGTKTLKVSASSSVNSCFLINSFIRAIQIAT